MPDRTAFCLFTKPVERAIAANPDTYSLSTFTHVYQQGYGSPEVDQTKPKVVNHRVQGRSAGPDQG